MATKISNAAAQAAVNAIAALLNSGKVRIYSGSQPADPDTAVSSQTLLAELSLGSTAFAAATDTNPGATAAANTITGDTAADATGTAAWFRAVRSAGNGGAAVVDGSVTATGGGGDLQLNTTSIVANADVEITSWALTMPES